MPFCRKCGFEYNEGDVHCNKCGTKIDSTSVSKGIYAEEEKRYCSNCGSEYNEGDSFCKRCLRSLKPDIPGTVTKTTPSSSSGLKWLLLVVILIGLSAIVSFASLGCITKSPDTVGGSCSYEKFRGIGKIISIHQTEPSKQQAGNSGYEGFEVKFRFTPAEPINLENVEWVKNTQEDVLDREYTLLLANSWYPGQKYLEKYGIKENVTFDGELRLITKGTCSPIEFNFDAIDTTDYFETKR